MCCVCAQNHSKTIVIRGVDGTGQFACEMMPAYDYPSYNDDDDDDVRFAARKHMLPLFYACVCVIGGTYSSSDVRAKGSGE